MYISFKIQQSIFDIKVFLSKKSIWFLIKINKEKLKILKKYVNIRHIQNKLKLNRE